MKNATILALEEPLDFQGADFSQHEWAAPGPHDSERWGFVHAVAGAFAYEPPGAVALRFKHSKRALPASVVADEVERRVEELGRPTSRKERSRIKDDVVFDLLPQAFVTHSFVDVLVVGRRLVVGSASPGEVDRVCSLLRGLLGSLPASPVIVKYPNRLTRWVAGSDSPPDMEVGDSCTIHSPHGGEARFKNADAGPWLDAHPGDQVVRAELSWESGARLELQAAPLVLRKIDYGSTAEDGSQEALWTFRALWFAQAGPYLEECLGGVE